MFVELKLNNEISKNSILNKIIKVELLLYFRLNLHDDIEIKWNNYFKNIIKIDIDCKDLLKFMLNNLHFTTDTNGNYVVMIDGNIKLPNTDYTLDKAIRLFNYGNLEIKGSHLITYAFDYLKQNIGKILMIKYFRVM